LKAPRERDLEAIHKISKFVFDTNWNEYPEAVRSKISLCALDSLGALVAGQHVKVANITAKYALTNWAGKDATIVSSNKKTGIKGAAFANAYAANALDIDDCGLYTKGHPGAQLFPTALALAELKCLSGKEMLELLVIGYELAHRIGRCWHDFYDVYRAGGSWGSVACAGMAARSFGLSEEELFHAFGIAEYNSPYIPIMRDVKEPKMVKHGMGLGPVNGITSAELARIGFTGTSSILLNKNYLKWVNDIGSNYIIVEGICWKEYCSCAWTHPTLDAVRDIIDKNTISIDEIKQISVKTFREAVELGTRLPKTTEEAQFNLAWPIAALIVDGKVGPLQIEENRLTDQVIGEVAGKVEARESPEFTKSYKRAIRGQVGGRFGSSVEIRLKGGRRYSLQVTEGNLNYPQTGWDEERQKKKFRWLVNTVLDSDSTEELLDLTINLEEIKNLEYLVNLASS